MCGVVDGWFKQPGLAPSRLELIRVWGLVRLLHWAKQGTQDKAATTHTLREREHWTQQQLTPVLPAKCTHNSIYLVVPVVGGAQKDHFRGLWQGSLLQSSTKDEKQTNREWCLTTSSTSFVPSGPWCTCGSLEGNPDTTHSKARLPRSPRW